MNVVSLAFQSDASLCTSSTVVPLRSAHYYHYSHRFTWTRGPLSESTICSALPIIIHSSSFGVTTSGYGLSMDNGTTHSLIQMILTEHFTKYNEKDSDKSKAMI